MRIHLPSFRRDEWEPAASLTCHSQESVSPRPLLLPLRVSLLLLPPAARPETLLSLQAFRSVILYCLHCLPDDGDV